MFPPTPQRAREAAVPQGAAKAAGESPIAGNALFDPHRGSPAQGIVTRMGRNPRFGVRCPQDIEPGPSEPRKRRDAPKTSFMIADGLAYIQPLVRASEARSLSDASATAASRSGRYGHRAARSSGTSRRAPTGRFRPYVGALTERLMSGESRVVRLKGLEPPRVSPTEPKSVASTNSATAA